MKYFSFLIVMLISKSYFAQFEEEMYGGEEMNQEAELIKIGKKGEFTLHIHNKEGGTFHYNLVDSKNNEVFPDVINSIDSSSNGYYIMQLDEMCLILDRSLKIIKTYEQEFTKIDNLNFYLARQDQLYVFDEKKFFIPLYEVLGLNSKATKNLNITLGGNKNEHDLYQLVYTPSYEDHHTMPHNRSFVLNMKIKKLSEKYYEHIEFFGDTIFAYSDFVQKSVDILNPNLEVVDSYVSFVRYKDFLFDQTQYILAKQHNQKWIILSKDLKKITDQEFDTIIPINLGQIKVNSGYEREIIYDDKIRFDKNHHYIAKLNDKWLYLDKKGTILFECNQVFKPLENEIYMLTTQNGKSSFLNKLGEKIIPYDADSVLLFNSNIFLKHEQKWQLYSTSKRKFIYEEIEKFQALNWGLFAFLSGKKWALVNGNNFPEQLIYEFDSFKLGAYKQLIVSKNKKWGILNLRRKDYSLIYPITYDYIKVYDYVVYEIHQKGKIELFANTEGSNEKKYDKVYFTLIHQDFDYPFVMHCYSGKTKELVMFRNENLYGM